MCFYDIDEEAFIAHFDFPKTYFSSFLMRQFDKIFFWQDTERKNIDKCLKLFFFVNRVLYLSTPQLMLLPNVVQRFH